MASQSTEVRVQLRAASIGGAMRRLFRH